MAPEFRLGVRVDGPHARYRDPRSRAALMALLGTAWPRVPKCIDAARDDGWDWDLMTEPFAVDLDGAPIAHAGVLIHPIRVAGTDCDVAGVHAVCTAPEHRRQGHARTALDEATRWIDAHGMLAKLHTAVPEVYEPLGFRSVPVHRFRVERAGGRDVPETRPPQLEDLHARLARRAPVSDRFASRDPGWLFGIDLRLGGRDVSALQLVDDLDVVVDWSVDDSGTLRIDDLVADELPSLQVLCAEAPRHRAVELSFCPDLLAPEATPIAAPEEGVLMIRGDWPLSADVPLGYSPLSEH